MLPRTLDAAVTEPLIAAAKYLSVPLLIGLPFALGWPRMSFIVRGVFLVEFIATFFRLGCLYLIWPERLCNNYLLDDQQRLGQYMLLIDAALFLGLAGKLVWGRFDSLARRARLLHRRRAGAQWTRPRTERRFRCGRPHVAFPTAITTMQLTRFTDYALRVLLFVGRQRGRVCTMGEIAAYYRISLEHLRKWSTSSPSSAISIPHAAGVAAWCWVMSRPRYSSATLLSRWKKI